MGLLKRKMGGAELLWRIIIRVLRELVEVGYASGLPGKTLEQLCDCAGCVQCVREKRNGRRGSKRRRKT